MSSLQYSYVPRGRWEARNCWTCHNHLQGFDQHLKFILNLRRHSSTKSLINKSVVLFERQHVIKKCHSLIYSICYFSYLTKDRTKFSGNLTEIRIPNSHGVNGTILLANFSVHQQNVGFLTRTFWGCTSFPLKIIFGPYICVQHWNFLACVC